jgi:uncharacterized membrane protein YcaP (DUF421 family)
MAMQTWLEQVWGHGEQLGALPMAVRATAMFFIVLAFVRFGGARIFGKKSAFDNVVVIMLGAVGARGIVGASPFMSTVAAGAVLVVLHRVLARLCVTSERLGTALKGSPVPLYANGKLVRENLARTTISESDLLESHRLETQRTELEPDMDAFMERNGRISFVKRGSGGTLR